MTGNDPNPNAVCDVFGGVWTLCVRRGSCIEMVYDCSRKARPCAYQDPLSRQPFATKLPQYPTLRQDDVQVIFFSALLVS